MKAVLAYSGGLDTSVILKWLQETYNAEIITFTADIGQGEELNEAIEKAKSFGVSEIYADNLQEEFVRDFVFPMFRANTLYEGTYLLGTSIARPIIAKRQIEIAKEVGADTVVHGATGKGNDQVRFELAYYALNPSISVIAPWREWELQSRSALLEYAAKHGIDISGRTADTPPYSTDANLLHISYEGKILEDPWQAPEESMFTRTRSLEDASEISEIIEITFDNGDPVAIDNNPLSPAQLLSKLNEYGKTHGIGRIDIVESRYVGMKSRGVYETPGGTILLAAHRAIESITLDRKEILTKDKLMPEYANLIYNGFWYSPEREMLQQAIDYSQRNVNGVVRLKLYKGNVVIIGRKSHSHSLYNAELVTFEEDEIYNQQNAEGFIRLNALRLQTAQQVRKPKF